MKKILVTGAGGQLGSELQQLSVLYPAFNFLFTDSKTLPLGNKEALQEYIAANKPDYCLNCAAYTAVDKAESEPETAMLINGTAVGWIAAALAEYGGQLIHVSTDYVFDGTAKVPISEEEPVNPLGVYGASKLKGEQFALVVAPSTIVIRTSWVYSSYGKNFVKTMLRLMSEREEINVVEDQVGSPTYAADLAKAILDIVEYLEQDSGKNDFGGIYHYSNGGEISWYDFAVAIRNISGSKCKVNPIPSSAYPTPAKRPSYSVFSKEKIQNIFGIRIVPWEDSLKSCLMQLQQWLA